MKRCPKCSVEHSKPGIYCSYKCANSRKWTEEDKRKKSEGALKAWADPTEAMIKARHKRGGTSSTRRTNLMSNYYRTGSTEGLKRPILKYILSLEQNCTCALCGVGKIWNDKPLIFHLDHIDGNKENNGRSNIRLLCPNCHSQQITSYRRKSVLKKLIR